MNNFSQDMEEYGKWTTMVLIWRNMVNGLLWSRYEECDKWTTIVFIWRNVVNGALWSGYVGVW